MRGRNLNLLAFVLICATITYYDMKKCHRLPWPPRFVFAGMTFFLMEGVSIIDETLAGVIAIGMVIAIFLKKGLVSNCQGEFQGATGQPAKIGNINGNAEIPSWVGDYTGPQQGIPSVAEFQAGQQQQQSPGNVTL